VLVEIVVEFAQVRYLELKLVWRVLKVYLC